MHMVWQSSDQEIAVIGTYIDIATGVAAASSPPAGNTTAPVITVPAGRFRPRGRLNRRQEDPAVPEPGAPATGAPSTLLETVFAQVGDITTPGTVTKTPGLVLSEVVDLWAAGSFQAYVLTIHSSAVLLANLVPGKQVLGLPHDAALQRGRQLARLDPDAPDPGVDV